MENEAVERFLTLVRDPKSVDALLTFWEKLVVPPPPPSGGSLIRVGLGNDLQKALDIARRGDTVLLDPNITWAASLVLPFKEPGPGIVTLRGGPGSRLVAPNNSEPALRTEAKASGYWIEGLEITAQPMSAVNDLVLLGDGSAAQSSLDSLPTDITLSKCHIHGHDQGECKRGVALNCGEAKIISCTIDNIKRAGQDAQAICGWNGPGPYVIEDNYLEASGENILFGGSDPWIDGLVPSDIIIRGNHFMKPLAWRNEPWTVKNLLELKNARRVTIEGNIFENNWGQAQAGYAIVMTSVNQDGRAPWSVVEDVTFANNIVCHSGGAFNLYGGGGAGMRRITITNNLCTDIDGAAYNGEGAFLQVGEVDDLDVTFNTAFQSGNIIKVYGKPSSGFHFHANIMPHNAYGILGDSSAVGKPTLEAFFPRYQWTSNVFPGANLALYPVDTFAPALDDLFVDWKNGDFRVRKGSRHAGQGCDFAALPGGIK